MGWTDAATGLAKGAISRSRCEIWFNRIERTDFYTFIAIDTGGFDLAF
jgi:hypothetical protein